MKFYITPDQVSNCKKRLARMFSHFTNTPNVTYSKVHKVKQETQISENGRRAGVERIWIDAVCVEIDEIKMNEWVLVASIYFADQIVSMVSTEYFKVMPAQYGLHYTKCDACGSTRESRKEMHVLYNTETNEWKQVGSSCVNKMINGGKYISTFALQLYKYVDIVLGGCDEEDWGGGWMPKSKYCQKAISFDDAICVAREYRKTYRGEYLQPEYDDYGKKVKYGTLDNLISYECNDYTGAQDADVIANVKAYIQALPESDYHNKMRAAIENEYINLYDMHLAFFAVKGWEESQGGGFAGYVKDNGIAEGVKLALDVELTGIRKQASYFAECEYVAHFVDNNGIQYRKTIAGEHVLDAYNVEGKRYRFNASVKWISTERSYIGLGGRLSKYNAR